MTTTECNIQVLLKRILRAWSGINSTECHVTTSSDFRKNARTSTDLQKNAKFATFLFLFFLLKFSDTIKGLLIGNFQ